MIQIPIDTDELETITRFKKKHGHSWIECLRCYADIYDKCEADKE